MNKLVSKSPIQRFKQGRKIVKAYGGITLNILGHKTEVGPTASKFLRKIKGAYDYYNANSGATEDFGLMHGRTGNPITFIRNIIDGNTKNPNQKTVQQQDTPVTGKMVSSDSPLLNINRAIDNYVDGMNQRKKLGDFGLKPGYPSGFKAGYNDYGNSQSSTSKKTITKPINNRWVNGIQKRDEITDVRATQQMLKDAGYLYSDKYNVVDGKWGSDTENAYKKYLLNKERPVVAPVQTEIPQIAPLLAQTTLNQASKALTNFTPQPVTRTFNKSEIRDFIRSKGKGAYDFTGEQRKALRMVMNGQGTDEDKAIVKGMGLFKVGGQLVSRNAVKRFKNKKK